ncbi:MULTISPECIES: nucleotide exchange factor GrpE [unclassified Streptomyces]|uniref:nucleotide exchange factor GrpE n=1 Tax=unclassified Streptomyces TaxID=2593676 RepID=UPI000360CCA9|nr:MULTISPECIES: nucleotide exchange factor GrpE [unclassified Streptomyces]MYT27659.1 nucleotide exchange factor GrpE [Streptomyces sp. SID8354]
MNRPTDVGRRSRPPLALVGRTGSERGPAPPPRPEPDPVRPDRESARAATHPARRRGASSGAARTPAGEPDAERLAAQLRERTSDLQRLKAEFDNYRRRVHRDRLAVGQIAVGNVLERLLPVLDALAEATAQGELTGGFRRVAELLEAELASLGLTSFGAAGEPFDPHVHEAVAYTPPERTGPATPGATDERTVCAEIVRRGFRVGDRLLRPAEVTVTGRPPDPQGDQLA